MALDDAITGPVKMETDDEPEQMKKTKKGILLSTEEEEEEEDIALPSPPTAAAAAGIKQDKDHTAAAGADATADVQQADMTSRLKEDGEDDDALYSNIIPTAAASDRFRNALVRVQADSTKDVAAWSALITEAQLLARDNMDAQIILLESCYGALLKVFPYSARHWANVADFLMTLSDPENYEVSTNIRRGASRKLDRVFRDALGVGVGVGLQDKKVKEGENAVVASVKYGPCSSSIELWKLYIHKRVMDARSDAKGIAHEREMQIAAYEEALERAGFVSNCNELWTAYISIIKMLIREADDRENTKEKQELMLRLRSIYQRVIGVPMQNLDDFWKEYESYEQSMSEALAQALIAEHLPRFQHSKQIFLERKQYSIDLKLTRLAVPPENTEMEKNLILRWKKRCAYERTNPERLSASGLSQRVRQIYKDCVCVLTRHPEIFHEWASWEAGGHCGGGNEAANAVFDLAEKHMPDSALIVAAHAEHLESTGSVDRAIQCFQNFVRRSPCSLGFILLQRIVRRIKGVNAARKIFSRARRCLLTPEADKMKGGIDAATASQQAGAAAEGEKDGETKEAEKPLVVNATIPKKMTTPPGAKVGIMTWHVFAAHAHMELRMNGFREVAARIFELGLSKHNSFMHCPPYISAYAKVLLETGDEDNFRSLLERAISACEDVDLSKESQQPLWDLLLEFESNVARAGGDPNVIRQLEARRQRALGTESSDILPKVLEDQLSRSDGENSGLISGGLGRLLGRYELIGIASDSIGLDANMEKNETGGGSPDASFSKRYHGETILPTPNVPAGMTTMLDRSKAARERMQAGATAQHQQQSVPEWLRNLIDVLPISRVKHARPPPHLIEMALTSLKNSPLPEKPAVVAPPLSGIAKATEIGKLGEINGSAKKRSRTEDGNSSDEDGAGSGGHGSLFRMRQRARQATAT